MTNKEKMNEIMRMCIYYVAQQNTHLSQDDLASQTFDKIERFIHEHSNTMVTLKYYSSLNEFKNRINMEGFMLKTKEKR